MRDYVLAFALIFAGAALAVAPAVYGHVAPVVADVWGFVRPSPSAPRPGPLDLPPPAELFGFDATLPPVLAGRPEVASRLAGICDGLADVVLYDGAQETPRYRYAVNVADLRARAIVYATEGAGLEIAAPGLGAALAPAFDRELGDGGQELTPAMRARAAELFRAVAHVSRKAER